MVSTTLFHANMRCWMLLGAALRRLWAPGGAKEHPTMENSDVLNRNFDLSVVDHIGQSLQ